MRTLLALLAFVVCLPSFSQRPQGDPVQVAMEALAAQGLKAEALGRFRVADSYVDAHNGIRHTWLRQQWQGIDIFNSEVAVHQNATGEVIALTHQLVQKLSATAELEPPSSTPENALRTVLDRDGLRVTTPALVNTDAARHRWSYAGDDFGGERPFVELVRVRVGDALKLAWNVNYFRPDGAHWWNVRIDANTGRELERNDWVSSCGLGDEEEELPPPASPNDYRVYPQPVESPDNGVRALRNAPWALAPIASPYGWHDTNGAAGAEYTITRGNNVWAQEDANANNGTGYSPNSAALDFDYPIDLTGAPITYRDAAIANAFYWNNVMHDVLYHYGFDEVSGNFQSNNYGRGGAGSDWLFADAQDGSFTNNANFATPPDGSNPRMQLALWNYTTPARDADLCGSTIAHEFGHGVANRLVGGPSNTDCMANAEQMGEGWSDWFGMMMTMEPGDAGSDGRGFGNYLYNQPVSGVGLRPARYSTNFAVNNYTYGSTNTIINGVHGIGFVWCTILWDMSWALIDQYGFDPDLYNGTGGNNRALQLVLDGMKYTPCSPGFVDARNAILQADQINYGGADLPLLWSVFAARGLGYSADQGSNYFRNDQTEAFDVPTNTNVGVNASLAPAPGVFYNCENGAPVTLRIRNNGLHTQGNFHVSYRLDGGAVVTQLFPGTVAPGFTTPVTFSTPLVLPSMGAHTLKAWTSLPADQYHPDDTLNFTVNWQGPVTLPFAANAEDGLSTPNGWTAENPDNLYTWANVSLAVGANCAATKAFHINYYNYGGTGEEDRLVSPLVNLAGSAGTHLRFHHAYAGRTGGYDDGLRVEISSTCGTSWTTLYSAFGAALATTPQAPGNWVPTNCSQWLLHDIDLSAYDGGTVLLRFTGICDFGNELFIDNISLVNNGVKLALKVLLDGPYDTNALLMKDDLRAAGLLPASEPYTGSGFSQASDGGGETMQSGVTSATGNNAIVDWVQVELRNAITPTMISATRAALLQRDGDLVDVDGASPIALLAAAGNYQVAVRHRDHLGVMTSLPVALSTSTTSIDFTNPATLTYGTNAQKVIGANMLLWAGDATGEGVLKYTGSGNDRDPILTAVGSTTPNNTLGNVYDRRDTNLDGVIKYTGSGNDRDIILTNVGSTTPNNTRTQQLP